MNRDLVHFLRLGLLRVRHRTNTLAQETAPAATKEIESLKILEDLIMEQVPHENTDHSTR